MGVARAGNLETVGQSNAQFSGGSLRFNAGSGQYLTKTFSNAPTSTKIQTFSWWVKLLDFSNSLNFFPGPYGTNGSSEGGFSYRSTGDTYPQSIKWEVNNGSNNITTTQKLRDASSWYHIVAVYDISNSTSTERLKLYINGNRVNDFAASSFPATTIDSPLLGTGGASRIGSYTSGTNSAAALIAQVYGIDGQALDPSYFGYTDPLTNTWRPKKYTGTYGTNGFWLPLDGNTPIGQDRSGNNNNWTPVNFGGSNTIEKATGALPILNTDGGGKVARVGVRTDSNASSLVLALPLVGIKSDFSNAINSGTSNKAITANSATASSSYSNFYGGSFYFNGSSNLAIPQSTEFDFGSGDCTVECWLYISSHSQDKTIAGRWEVSDQAWQLSYGVGSGNTKFGFSQNIGGTQTAESSVVSSGYAGQWVHLAGQRTGNTLQIYVNGVLEGTKSVSGAHSALSGDIRIGGRTSGNYITGYIQDLRIYKGLAKYTQNFIPPSTDPDILPDTPSGVSYSSNVALVPSTDGGVAFDGSGDYLTVSSTNLPKGSSSRTVEFFVYIDSNYSSWQNIFSYGSSSSGQCFGINVGNNTSTNNWAFTGYSAGDWDTGVSSSGYWNKWTHVAVTYDGTNVRIFLNGISIGSAARSLNTTGSTFCIGGSEHSGFGENFKGFISNFQVTDNVLYTANFTPPTGPITSVANTKLLCCKSNSSATAADVTPGTITANGNAAASNFNPFTVNINTQRGQESGWCTLDPLAGDNAASPTPATFTNGNLTVSYNRQSSGAPWCPGTIAIPSSGKWYWEFVPTASSPTPPATLYGISNIADSKKSVSSVINRSIYLYDGQKVSNTTYSSYASGFSVGDTVGIAVNMDSGIIGFYKNGIYLGNAFTDLISSGYTWVPFLGMGGQNSGTTDANFGQKPFKFPPPPGFQPLALANTPRPTIVRPDQYVGIVTYTGTGSTRDVIVGWKPDLVWIKSRSDAQDNNLFDSVRGPSSNLYALQSNATSAEGQYNTFSSLDAKGFTLGPQAGALNGNGTTNVAWCWKAGGNSNTYNINDIGYSTAAAAGLTAGSITPTGASVNTKSGFSIITYTGTNANATISHGLGNVPAFIIAKSRDTSSWNWIVYHKSLGVSDYLALESTQGSDTRFANIWGTGHTTSVFGVRAGYSNNPNGERMVAYCWAEIPGFSKFGSYTGDGSTSGFGPFINCGFRPRYVLIKSTTVAYSWLILDSVRNPNNLTTQVIYANSATAEMTNNGTGSGGYESIDILSNGFQIKSNSSRYNQSGQTYIYAAFAESPTFNLYGGQSNAR